VRPRVAEHVRAPATRGDNHHPPGGR
jgi:hypothetical protein